jgi:hypothetical protein
VPIFKNMAGLTDISQRTPSQVIADGADSTHGKTLAPLLADNPGKNRMYELARGLAAFAARIVMARNAERSIDTHTGTATTPIPYPRYYLAQSNPTCKS